MKHIRGTTDTKQAAREASQRARETKAIQWPDYSQGRVDIGTHDQRQTPDSHRYRKDVTGRGTP
jgi:hypothetical protein